MYESAPYLQGYPTGKHYFFYSDWKNCCLLKSTVLVLIWTPALHFEDKKSLLDATLSMKSFSAFSNMLCECIAEIFKDSYDITLFNKDIVYYTHTIMKHLALSLSLSLSRIPIAHTSICVLAKSTFAILYL